jgi:Tol biopolymer transport system component
VKVLAASKSYDLWESHFSPDGRWIAFEAVKRDGSGSATVEVIPATGGAAAEGAWVPVTDPHDWSDKPRWSPDSRVIYFVRPNGPLWNLWGVRFDNIQGKPIGAPFQVTHFDTAARQISAAIGNPNIAISAKRLILTMMERSGGIWTVDNVER